jgi:hypothetical protein
MWTKAKNIKQGEQVNTKLGSKLVLESFRMPHSGHWAITVMGQAFPVTFYFPPDSLLERLGPTIATLRREKTTHRSSMEHPGFTLCNRKVTQGLAFSHQPSCEKCWWSR